MPTDVSDADVLSEYDPKDPSAIPEETRRKAKEVADSALPRKGSLKGVRIGVPRVSSPPPPLRAPRPSPSFLLDIPPSLRS
jgi:hypothetical protein